MERKCYSIREGTSDRCKNPNLPGSRYCWHHYPKLPLWLSLFMSLGSSLLFLPVQDVWQSLFPSATSTQIGEIAATVDPTKRPLHSVDIVMDIEADVNYPRDKKFPLPRTSRMNWMLSGDNYLVATAGELAILPRNDQYPTIRYLFHGHQLSSAFRRPVDTLANVNEISVYGALPDSIQIFGGSMQVVFNDDIRVTLTIMPQVIKKNRLIIRDVAPLGVLVRSPR